ncbi:hypothetical protein [Bacillus sp. HU-1818]|nr:hypothetical protein [Bacillus sp. HU-1818]
MRKTSVLFILAKSEAAPFNGIYVINHLVLPFKLTEQLRKKY